MPIQTGIQLQRLDQEAFGKVAYKVMNCLFGIHSELGRFFDEGIYKEAFRKHYPGVELDVPLDVTFEDFHRRYLLDTVVDGGAVFDLKAVEALTNRHRSWLVNTLMLADLAHSKLVNMRSERVEHDFVNNISLLADRRNFTVVADRWSEMSAKPLQPWFTAFLRSIGAGLDISLYEDAITHWYGGEEQVLRELEVTDTRGRLGRQPFLTLAPRVAFKVTAFFNSPDLFERNARKLFAHTSLEAVQWINVTREEVVFRTLRK